MVVAFPPGTQDVFVSGVGKMFLVLSHKFSWFVCFSRILRSLLFWELAILRALDCGGYRVVVETARLAIGVSR